MDKNQITGIVLMFALLAIYFTFLSPEPSETPEKEPIDTVSVPNPKIQKPTEVVKPSEAVVKVQNQANYGIYSFAAEQPEQTEVISNQDLEIIFTNQGGKIKQVVLKKYENYLNQPLKLMDSTQSNYSYFLGVGEKTIDISKLSFQSDIKYINDTIQLIYQLTHEKSVLTHTYTIPPVGYQIKMEIKTMEMHHKIKPKDIQFVWHHNVTRAEKNLEDERINCSARYYLLEKGYDGLPESALDLEQQIFPSPVKWISFKQKFFNIGLIANKNFGVGGQLTSYANQLDTNTVKRLSVQLIFPYTEFLNQFNMRFYFGPNHYNHLKDVTIDYDENLDMGWGPLPWVNIYLIIPIFHFLEKHLTNYGLIILIIVLVVRLLLSPLTWKSHMSMAKMRVMKPELDSIKKKNDNDLKKVQQDQMTLYQSVGINPLSGCLPTLLQMPILFALFFFFPNSVELRQKSFLWAHDLSTYDSIVNLPFEIPFYGHHVSLFTILMTASTILYTWSNSQITTMQGPAKNLQYIMPFMFLFILNSFASGLTYYYFISNLVTFGQTLLFRKLVDENKIKKMLEENRKKNAGKKKTRFQQRLEDAMKTRPSNGQKQKGKK